MSDINPLFMKRAIELATRGIGMVAPNPLVGCVIVRDGRIISEGWHQRHGGPHAEVMAMDNLKDKSLVEGAEMYISLEPCSHHGLTPPCAPMLAALPFAKFIIAGLDPDPRVQGRGIEILKKAGKDVVVGILEKESREVNHRFITFHEKQRPYIILKWAQSADGYIASASGEPRWVSNAMARRIVHKWRAEQASILVGNTTAEKDDPKLNTRDWSGRDPVRIVIDRKLSLGKDLKIYSDDAPTLTYNLTVDKKEGNKEFIAVQKLNFIKEIMTDLYRRNIQSVMVEGGATIHQAFLAENMWDECRIFQSLDRFGDGILAPPLPSTVSSCETIMDNHLLIVKNTKNG